MTHAPSNPHDPVQKKSLTQRFVSMSAWSVAQIGGGMIVRLGGNLILTRLLMPEVFGLIAFATMVLVGATMFIDIGIERSVVRDKDGGDEHYLMVAWTMRLCVAASISVITVLFALAGLPLVRLWASPESVLAAPEIAGVVAIISLTPIIRGLGSINEALAQRHLQLNRLAPIEIGAQFLGLSVIIAAVYMWPSVWTMAVAMLAGTIFKSVFTHLFLSGPRMRLAWDPAIAIRLWDFGKWLIIASMFAFLGNFAERLIFSTYLEVRLFALYSIGRLWAEAAQTVMTFIISNAGTAALSEVLRTPGRDASRPFARMQQVVDILCLVGFLGFFFLIDPFIQLLYNESFEPAGQYAPLLALLALRMRFNTFGALLMSAGNTRSVMVICIMEAISAWVLIWTMLQYFGFEAAIVAYAASKLISVPYMIILSRPHLPHRNFAIDWAWLALTIFVSIGVALSTQ